MSAIDVAEIMLSKVVKALGSDLIDSVACVGGCTTGFHVTDELAAQSVRFTDEYAFVLIEHGSKATD